MSNFTVLKFNTNLTIEPITAVPQKLFLSEQQRIQLRNVLNRSTVTTKQWGINEQDHAISFLTNIGVPYESIPNTKWSIRDTRKTVQYTKRLFQCRCGSYHPPTKSVLKQAKQEYENLGCLAFVWAFFDTKNK